MHIFFSYFIQMKKIRELNPKTVLEIGPGEGFIQQYMKQLGIAYDTMDIISESNPTYLSKLEDFDANNAMLYDVVCSFQMLEHSDYKFFKSNLMKMKELSKKYVFISLPYSCYKFSFGINIQLGQDRRISRKVNKPNRKYRKQYVDEFPWAVHYFEIGRKGFSKKKIFRDMKDAGLNILDTFHSENAFHYFILAEKVVE